MSYSFTDREREEIKRRYRLDTESIYSEYEHGPLYVFTLSRRDLLMAGLLGAGVTLGVATAADREVARFHFGDDGTVTLLTSKIEMGQGARTLLSQAAAEELRLPIEKIRIVMGDTGLVPDDGGTWASMTTPYTVPVVRKAAAAVRNSGLAPASQWKVLGSSVKPLHGRDIVTGALRYAGDRRPAGEFLYAKVIRAPGARAKLVNVTAPPEVKLVRDGNLAGVLAGSARQAASQAASVKAQWEVESLPSKAEWMEQLRKKSTPPVAQPNAKYPPLTERGDWRAGLSESDHVHTFTYDLGSIAHAPLEPRAAIAHWKEGELTVWSGTQAPFMVRRQLAEAFRVPEAKVRVIVSEPGGAFGGKQSGECELEVARLARDAGRPVKLQWTREEEFTCSYARPAGLIDVRSGTKDDGRIHAWEFRNYNSGPAALPVWYAIPHLICAFHRADSPIRQGSYRSLAAVANTFARETQIEEMAAFHKADPVEFRLKNISDARMNEALQRGAKRFGWGKKKGAAYGVACNIEKDARLALFTEVEPKGKQTRVVRALMVFDAGAALNPDGLKNQIMGAIVQGIGGALFEELHLDGAGIRNRRFSDYRVPRFSDVPSIDIELIDRREIDAAGAGESPITVVAPALSAAIFAGTGQRRRSLPLLG